MNRPSAINEEAIARMQQIDINYFLDIPPVVAEVKKTINQLPTGKAPGSDAIPAEVYKTGGPSMTEKLTELFQSFWTQVAIPQELKDAPIVHLYKRKLKGNLQACDNRR